MSPACAFRPEHSVSIRSVLPRHIVVHILVFLLSTNYEAFSSSSVVVPAPPLEPVDTTTPPAELRAIAEKQKYVPVAREYGERVGTILYYEVFEWMGQGACLNGRRKLNKLFREFVGGSRDTCAELCKVEPRCTGWSIEQGVTDKCELYGPNIESSRVVLVPPWAWYPAPGTRPEKPSDAKYSSCFRRVDQPYCDTPFDSEKFWMNVAHGAGASACAEGITIALGGICSLRCVQPFVSIASSGRFLCTLDPRSKTGASLQAFDEVQPFLIDCVDPVERAARLQMSNIADLSWPSALKSGPLHSWWYDDVDERLLFFRDGLREQARGDFYGFEAELELKVLCNGYDHYPEVYINVEHFVGETFVTYRADDEAKNVLDEFVLGTSARMMEALRGFVGVSGGVGANSGAVAFTTTHSNSEFGRKTTPDAPNVNEWWRVGAVLYHRKDVNYVGMMNKFGDIFWQGVPDDAAPIPVDADEFTPTGPMRSRLKSLVVLEHKARDGGADLDIGGAMQAEFDLRTEDYPLSPPMTVPVVEELGRALRFALDVPDQWNSLQVTSCEYNRSTVIVFPSGPLVEDPDSASLCGPRRDGACYVWERGTRGPARPGSCHLWGGTSTSSWGGS